MDKSKTILITGGAGFIGSHLCETLVSNGFKNVFSLDNYSTGSQFNHIDGVNYIEGSTTSIKNLINFTPDYIFHLGEYSRVEQSFDDLNEVWTSNTLGTFQVLKFALNSKSKLIYAGSSTKFADGGIGSSQSPYGWTKATNTDLVKNFGDWFGLNYAVVYFYNAYGGRELSSGKYATLIGIYREAMKKGQSLKVVSPGRQLRNFTYVEDIITALLLVADKGNGDEFGIGHNEEWTVMEVAELFGGKIEILPERKGNRMSAILVTDKTRSLGWRPSKRLPDYIETLRLNNWDSLID